MENTEKKKITIEDLRKENLRNNVAEGQTIEVGDTVQADVKIIEGSKHPFIQTTTMLLPDEEVEHITDRLENSS